MEPEGRRDVDRQAELLVSWIRALVRRFQIAERADVSCCGMTVAQAAILEALREHGPLRLGPLSRKLGIAPSTLTRNLERVEARGLVERRADARDGRAARLGLTALGERAAADLERQEAGFARRVIEELPAGERERTVAGLQSLLVAVGRATEACCPGAFDHLFKDLKRVPRAGGAGDEVW